PYLWRGGIEYEAEEQQNDDCERAGRIQRFFGAKLDREVLARDRERLKERVHRSETAQFGMFAVKVPRIVEHLLCTHAGVAQLTLLDQRDVRCNDHGFANLVSREKDGGAAAASVPQQFAHHRDSTVV